MNLINKKGETVLDMVQKQMPNYIEQNNEDEFEFYKELFNILRSCGAKFAAELK